MGSLCIWSTGGAAVIGSAAMRYACCMTHDVVITSEPAFLGDPEYTYSTRMQCGAERSLNMLRSPCVPAGCIITRRG
jgi:hypothetical protein